MYIERTIEKELIQQLDFFPAVLLIGPRQVGKTTLSQRIRKQLQKDSIYLDLEDLSARTRLEDPAFYLEMNKEKTVILDEIQNMPDIFSPMRSLIDKYRVAGRFLILGSATPSLLRQSAQSLAGRLAYLEIHPFLLDEIPTNKWKHHWLVGGYPLAFTAPNTNAAQRWLLSFERTYIERDLSKIGLNIGSLQLQRLLQILAAIHGTPLNKSMIAKSLGVSVPTISRYLDFLEGAFLIRRLPPFFENIRKRLVKSPKIYFRDTGLLHLLLRLHSIDDVLGYVHAGNSWEGYVLQQLIGHLHEFSQAYYYQTPGGSEIDLVVVKGLRPVATFEIKLSSAPKIGKGWYEAIKSLNTTNNYIVCPIEEKGYSVQPHLSIIGVREAIEIIKKL